MCWDPFPSSFFRNFPTVSQLEENKRTAFFPLLEVLSTLKCIHILNSCRLSARQSSSLIVCILRVLGKKSILMLFKFPLGLYKSPLIYPQVAVRGSSLLLKAVQRVPEPPRAQSVNRLSRKRSPNPLTGVPPFETTAMMRWLGSTSHAPIHPMLAIERRTSTNVRSLLSHSRTSLNKITSHFPVYALLPPLMIYHSIACE